MSVNLSQRIKMGNVETSCSILKRILIFMSAQNDYCKFLTLVEWSDTAQIIVVSGLAKINYFSRMNLIAGVVGFKPIKAILMTLQIMDLPSFSLKKIPSTSLSRKTPTTISVFSCTYTILWICGPFDVLRILVKYIKWPGPWSLGQESSTRSPR